MRSLREGGPASKRAKTKAAGRTRQDARTPGRHPAMWPAARFAFLLRNTPIYRAALRAAGGQLGSPGEGLGRSNPGSRPGEWGRAERGAGGRVIGQEVESLPGMNGGMTGGDLIGWIGDLHPVRIEDLHQARDLIRGHRRGRRGAGPPLAAIVDRRDVPVSAPGVSSVGTGEVKG